MLLMILLPLMALSSCTTVGPDYEKVQPESNKDWVAEMEQGLEASRPEQRDLAKWWEVFGDPVLSRLEKEAVQGNLDLMTAVSRLRQARIKKGIRSSDLLPQLQAEGKAQRQKSSESVQSVSVENEQDWYLAGFDSSWELDLFGGIKRSVQAAKAEIEASEANIKDVLVSLMAEVARTYIEVRTYQQRLRITMANIKTQKKTYELNQSRHKAGLIDELAVQQSLRNLERTRSQISRLKSGLQSAKNQLAFLLGHKPGSLPKEVNSVQEIPEVPGKVAVGIPAEAMRRRPDIRRAERNLAAQTAKIGAATAELYPKFHLLGSIGLEALDQASDLLEANSGFWNIGPGLSWNIFQGKALRLNIELQTEMQKQALIEYKSRVLAAQKEIEDALIAYAKEQLRAASLKKAVAAAKRTEYLARDRFQAGLADFYNVLDAQRSLLQLEDELVQSKGEMSSNLARLYKALGGGWEFYSSAMAEQDKALPDD